jgi:hypothetical protein
MKRARSVTAACLITFLLSGCGTQLDESKLSAQIDLGDYKYSLVGDKALIIVNIENLNESDATYSVNLEAKNEANSWNIVDQISDVSGSISQSVTYNVEEEGEHLLRVNVVSNERILATSKEAIIVAKDLKSGVRKLFYDERIACEQNKSKCLDYKIDNTYPGLWKYSNLEKQSILKRYIIESDSTPDLTTISPDFEWLFPVTCEAKFIQLDVSKPLPGKTYIVETISENNRITIHITYLKGKFYYYEAFC